MITITAAALSVLTGALMFTGLSITFLIMTIWRLIKILERIHISGLLYSRRFDNER